MHLVQVGVPMLASPTLHPVVLRRSTTSNGALMGADTLGVRVTAVRTLELTATELPSFTIAGDSFDAVFAVRNAGNVAQRVRLAATVPHGARIAPSWSEAELAPGQVRTVALRVATRAELAREARHLIRLQAAISAGNGRDTVAARATGTVLVMPGRTARVSRMHEIPAKLRITSVGARRAGPGGRTSVAAELIGSGHLRDGGRTRIDFAIRPPQAGAPGFQARDEYRIKVSAPAYELVLGDQQFSLSPLTQQHQMAAGARGMLRRGAFSIAGFVARERHSRFSGASRGAQAAYRMGRTGFLQAQVLGREARDTGVVATLRARISPSPLLALEAEGGRSVTGAAAAKAYSVRLSGQNGRLAYGLWQQHAEAAYAGDGAGTTARSVIGSIRIAGPVRVRGAIHDRVIATDSTWKRARAGGASREVEGTASLGSTLSAGYHVLAREDIPTTGDREREEHFVRVTAQRRLGAVTLQGSIDRGAVRHRTDTTAFSLLRARAGMMVQTRRGHAFTAQVQSTSGASMYTMDTRPRLSANLSATVIPADRLSVRLQASGTREHLLTSPTITGAAEATVAYAPIKGHEIALAARSATFAMRDWSNATVRVTYSMPIGLPLGFSRTSGRVVGRVVDSETGRGMPNARVLLGDRLAITDSEGKIEINGLEAGTQYLQLDLGASGAARVPVPPMPMPIASRAGGTSRVEIPVTRSVRISGRIRKLAPASHATWDGSRGALIDTTGMPNVSVTLTRDGEVHRRVTDAQGSFTAADLRPGRWAITVDGSALPAHHYLEHPTVPLTIAPGQDAEVDFAVLPRKRALVMLDQAVIVADGAAPASRATGRALPRSQSPERTPPSRAETERTSALPRQAERPATAGPTRGAMAESRTTPPDSRTRPYAGESFYITSEADRTLENVAIWVYGDASLWRKLWLANRPLLRDPRSIVPGTLLRIPPKGPLTGEEIHAREELRSRRDEGPR